MTAELRIRDISQALRPTEPLSPDDTLAKAARLLRARQLPGLPVARGRHLVGVIYEADVLALAAGAADPMEAMRETRVEVAMRPVTVTLPITQPLTLAAEALRESGMPLALVIGGDGSYLGALLRRDLLAALSGEPALTQIAGLATPFGVHLTTGSQRAGANDFALASTGAALMVMNLLAVNGLEWLRGQAHRLWPALNALAPRGSTGEVVEGIIVGILSLVVFLLLLRLSPITGTHAAEHMVVHALEEGEDLTLEKVRALPRVHPRCGTNLVALLVMLSLGMTLFDTIRATDAALAEVVLLVVVVVVVITWRRLGGALQRFVTTKPPSDQQLQRAIRVGEELVRKAAQPGPVRAWRRFWNTGFVQVVAGFLVVLEVAKWGPRLFR